jgi:small subunit ribosomal protein S19
MSRSNWKGSFIHANLFRKTFIYINNKQLASRDEKIWARNSVIPSFLVEKFVNIYNGNTFKKFFISIEKVGFKFGDFSFSRNYVFKKFVKKKK